MGEVTSPLRLRTISYKCQQKLVIGRLGQPPSEESTPVGVKDVVDIGIAIASSSKDKLQLAQILRRLEVRRHVVGSTGISADSCVQCVPRQLTDVVDVIRYCFQFHILR